MKKYEIAMVPGDGIGDKIHKLNFRSRMGDGREEDTYPSRQPYFRDYPRLLVYENGVHFIDTYRFLAGEIHRVYAILKKLNPVIAGEDCGVLVFEFENGAVGIWDANRYNENNFEDPRYTFDEFLIDGNGGSIRLYTDGKITIQPLGQPEREHEYKHEKRNFSGDCCYFTQRHFIDRLIDGPAPIEPELEPSIPNVAGVLSPQDNWCGETNGPEYLKPLAMQDAVYTSAEQKIPVEVYPVRDSKAKNL